MSAKKAVPWFNLSAGSALFVIGLALLVKTFFISSEPSAYFVLIALNLITVGVFLAHGKFKGIKEPKG